MLPVARSSATTHASHLLWPQPGRANRPDGIRQATRSVPAGDAILSMTANTIRRLNATDADNAARRSPVGIYRSRSRVWSETAYATQPSRARRAVVRRDHLAVLAPPAAKRPIQRHRRERMLALRLVQQLRIG